MTDWPEGTIDLLMREGLATVWNRGRARPDQD